MAALTPQPITQSGVGPTYSAASAGGDTFVNDGRTFLHVKNGGGSAVNVTINAANPCDQGQLHNLTVSVPAGGDRMIGPFQVNRYNDANGNVSVSYSATASVTVAAIRLGS